MAGFDADDVEGWFMFLWSQWARALDPKGAESEELFAHPLAGFLIDVVNAGLTQENLEEYLPPAFAWLDRETDRSHERVTALEAARKEAGEVGEELRAEQAYAGLCHFTRGILRGFIQSMGRAPAPGSRERN